MSWFMTIVTLGPHRRWNRSQQLPLQRWQSSYCWILSLNSLSSKLKFLKLFHQHSLRHYFKPILFYRIFVDSQQNSTNDTENSHVALLLQTRDLSHYQHLPQTGLFVTTEEPILTSLHYCPFHMCRHMCNDFYPCHRVCTITS